VGRWLRPRPDTLKTGKATGGWMVPRAGQDESGKSRPHRDSTPGPSDPQRVAIPPELSQPIVWTRSEISYIYCFPVSLKARILGRLKVKCEDKITIGHMKRIGTGSAWLNTESSVRILWTGWWNFELKRMQEICWLANLLLDSEKGYYCKGFMR
jgi:hypothetical protein